MIITFFPTDLSHIGSYYYSPQFLITENNTTIQIKSNSILTINMEASIDGNNYFELPDTSFTTSSNGGIQSYSDAQNELFYRIKINGLPTEIKVLI